MSRLIWKGVSSLLGYFVWIFFVIFKIYLLSSILIYRFILNVWILSSFSLPFGNHLCFEFIESNINKKRYLKYVICKRIVYFDKKLCFNF